MWLEIIKKHNLYIVGSQLKIKQFIGGSTSHTLEVFLELFQGLELGRTQASTMARLGRSQVW